MYVFTFLSFLMCVYESTSCAFTFIQVVTSSSSSFHFSSVFIYACACCICFLLFLSVYTPLASYLINISYVLNMFGFFVLFYILLFFVNVYNQQESISPSWARAGCKKTLSLIYYPSEIKFVHSFIHSFIHSLSLSQCVERSRRRILFA